MSSCRQRDYGQISASKLVRTNDEYNFPKHQKNKQTPKHSNSHFGSEIEYILFLSKT